MQEASWGQPEGGGRCAGALGTGGLTRAHSEQAMSASSIKSVLISDSFVLAHAGGRQAAGDMWSSQSHPRVLISGESRLGWAHAGPLVRRAEHF